MGPRVSPESPASQPSLPTTPAEAAFKDYSSRAAQQQADLEASLALLQTIVAEQDRLVGLVTHMTLPWHAGQLVFEAPSLAQDMRRYADDAARVLHTSATILSDYQKNLEVTGNRLNAPRAPNQLTDETLKAWKLADELLDRKVNIAGRLIEKALTFTRQYAQATGKPSGLEHAVKADTPPPLVELQPLALEPEDTKSSTSSPSTTLPPPAPKKAVNVVRREIKPFIASGPAQPFSPKNDFESAILDGNPNAKKADPPKGTSSQALAAPAEVPVAEAETPTPTTNPTVPPVTGAPLELLPSPTPADRVGSGIVWGLRQGAAIDNGLKDRVIAAANAVAENVSSGAAALGNLAQELVEDETAPPKNPRDAALHQGPLAALPLSAEQVESEKKRIKDEARAGRKAEVDIATLALTTASRELGDVSQKEFDSLVTQAQALRNIGQQHANDPQTAQRELQHALLPLVGEYHLDVPNLAEAWLLHQGNCVARALSEYVVMRDVTPPPGYRLMYEHIPPTAGAPGHQEMVWWNGEHGDKAKVRQLFSGIEVDAIEGDLFEADAVLDGDHPDPTLLRAKAERQPLYRPTRHDLRMVTALHQRQAPVGNQPIVQASTFLPPADPARDSASSSLKFDETRLTMQSALFGDEVVSGVLHVPSGPDISPAWSSKHSPRLFVTVPTIEQAKAFAKASEKQRLEMFIEGSKKQMAAGRDDGCITVRMPGQKQVTISTWQELDSADLVTANEGFALRLPRDPDEFEKAVRAVVAGKADSYVADLLSRRVDTLEQAQQGKAPRPGLNVVKTPRQWSDPAISQLLTDMKKQRDQMQIAEQQFGPEVTRPARQRLKNAFQLNTLAKLFDRAPEVMIRQSNALAQSNREELLDVAELAALGRELTGAAPIPLHTILGQQFGTRPVQPAKPNSRRGRDTDVDETPPTDGDHAQPLPSSEDEETSKTTPPPLSADAAVALWRMSGDASLVAAMADTDYAAFARGVQQAAADHGAKPFQADLEAALLARLRAGKASSLHPGDGWDAKFGAVPLPLLCVLQVIDGSRHAVFQKQVEDHALEWLASEKGKGIPLHTALGDLEVSPERFEVLNQWVRQISSTWSPINGIDPRELVAANTYKEARFQYLVTASGKFPSSFLDNPAGEPPPPGHAAWKVPNGRVETVSRGPDGKVLRIPTGQTIWDPKESHDIFYIRVANGPTTVQFGNIEQVKALAASGNPIYQALARKAQTLIDTDNDLASWRARTPSTQGQPVPVGQPTPPPAIITSPVISGMDRKSPPPPPPDTTAR